jgi:penicillin V acylase-like amidase (Ntn superfamily)
VKKVNQFYLLLVTVVAVNSGSLQEIHACTRIVYQGTNGTIITARSMDWIDEIPANLWVFPRGMERLGEVGPNSIKWKSKYGSVIASTWDIATADGMNEKGLVANVLWLVESEYPEFKKEGNKKGLSISAWAQYFLDNFATVEEAVQEMRKEEFVVVPNYIPGTKRFTTLHLSISDATGDNAIFEYIGGKLVIHHDRAYNVMTNSPKLEEQLALNNYWKSISGTVMLPGTHRSADRFVRASYYINAIPQIDNTRVAIASVFSVIRNCSIPLGISTEEEPNISSTRWRSVSDQKHLTYFFETVMTPNTFWVDFKKVDFSEKASVKKLNLANHQIYAGEATNNFVEAKPFQFIGL